MKLLLYNDDIKCFDATLYEAFQKISLVNRVEVSPVSECHNQSQLTDAGKFRIFQLSPRIRQFSIVGTVGRLFK